MKSTFTGGTHLAEYKELSIGPSIRKARLPKAVYIPLLQHTGSPCLALVKPGSTVKTGQLIAKAEKFISSPVHASISGVVKKIDKYPHPVLGEYDAVLIESDGADTMDPSIKERRNAHLISISQLRDIIRDAGIVGLGGGAFPTHVKLTLPESKPIDSIILNGAECEPYLTSDHRLMLEKKTEIIEGLKIILRLTGAKRAYIAIESNKMGAVFNLEKLIKKDPAIEIAVLKTKYPQGAENQLIKVILNREVPAGGLPFDIGCVVHNIGTAVAIYEAVYKGKPLYERVVTITGDCIKEPCNLTARIGTPIKDLVENAGGFIKEPVKIIAGGPMMGLSQFDLDTPIIKSTTGLVFLSKDKVSESREEICIRCARCVDTCPVRMIPADIFRLVKNKRFSTLSEYNITDCIECGCCAYECPSKIPLVQWIKLGKQEFLKLKKRQEK